jgi:hypothetical protein
VHWGRINAVAPGRLVHIVDEASQRCFLVDTGAAYSIFPYFSPGKQSGPRLKDADGLHIPCWGERRLTLSFLGLLFVWPFLQAKVQFPIIGVDFLRHFKLLVDPAANRLVDTVSTQLLPTVSSVRSQPEPAETSAMATATPVGRSAASQVHVMDPAPASQPGCSQSGQPARAVTAVAADQPPARPRFIALPPGSLGSVILDEYPEVANASKVLPPSSHGVEHFISAAHSKQVSATRRRKAAGGQSGVRAAGAGGDRATLYLSMGQPSPNGHEEGRVMAAMRRLPPPQLGHRAGHLSSAQHAGFFRKGRWVQGF